MSLTEQQKAQARWSPERMLFELLRTGDEVAIEDARINSEVNGVINTQFVAGDISTDLTFQLDQLHDDNASELYDLAVKEAYLEKVVDHWVFRLGRQRFQWGVDGCVNSISKDKVKNTQYP